MFRKDELTFNPQEITERFVRGDESRNSEGSGLGLAIVEALQNCKVDTSMLRQRQICLRQRYDGRGKNRMI